MLSLRLWESSDWFGNLPSYKQSTVTDRVNAALAEDSARLDLSQTELDLVWQSIKAAQALARADPEHVVVVLHGDLNLSSAEESSVCLNSSLQCSPKPGQINNGRV